MRRNHLLPVDTSVHCGPDRDGHHSHCRPFVRTVVHLHGGHVPDHSDGYPEAWFTPGFGAVGPGRAVTGAVARIRAVPEGMVAGISDAPWNASPT